MGTSKKARDAIKRVLAMDPTFMDTSGEQVHDALASTSLVQTSDCLVEDWDKFVGNILRNKGTKGPKSANTCKTNAPRSSN